MHPGNVSDCMVVNDYKAHRQYNVFFLSERPAMDTGISFEGLGYSHPDPHCKQGQKVQVLSGSQCRESVPRPKSDAPDPNGTLASSYRK